VTTGRTYDMDVHGGRLQVRIDGPLRAPWLVFSNSLATNLTLWAPQVPVLLLAGAGDAGIATAFAELAQRDARLACRVIEGAGHLPNIEAADATNRVLAEFVSHA
jgi:pimeloyl-ACP methyl ester carboxylesterase